MPYAHLCLECLRTPNAWRLVAGIVHAGRTEDTKGRCHVTDMIGFLDLSTRKVEFYMMDTDSAFWQLSWYLAYVLASGHGNNRHITPLSTSAWTFFLNLYQSQLYYPSVG